MNLPKEFRKYIFIGIGVLMVVALLIDFLARRNITITQAPYKVATKPADVTWNGKKESDVVSAFEQNIASVIDTKQLNGDYVEKSVILKDPNIVASVITDMHGKIAMYIASPTQDSERTLEKQEQIYSLGMPSLIMYTADVNSPQLFVYATKGVAYELDPITRDIHQILLFEPTTNDIFKNIIGKKYLAEPAEAGY